MGAASILVAAHLVFTVLPDGRVIHDQAVKIERRACGQSYVAEVVNPMDGGAIRGRVSVRCAR